MWAGVGQDPREAESAGVERCTHACYVYAFDAAADYTQRQGAPPHMQLCMPSKHLQSLAQLRLGRAHLEVQLGRQQRPPVPRAQRLWRLCSAPGSRADWKQAVLACTGLQEGDQPASVEDTRHFLLECPAYDDIRVRFRLLPQQPWAAADPGACMRQFFAHARQSAVARMVFAMRAFRANLLQLPFW